MAQKIEDININYVECPSFKSKVTFSSKIVKGLQLVVKNNNRKEFHLRYTRSSDKTRNSIGLGLYPSEIPDLQTAYNLAKEKKELINKGVDPVLNKKIDQSRKRREQYIASAAIDESYSFTTIANDFLKYKTKTRSKETLKKYRQGVNNYLVGEIGGVDVRYIDYMEYESFILSIAEHSKSAAMNTHSTARAVLSYAVDKQIITANPLTGKKDLVKRIKVEPNAEYYTPKDIHKFLNEIDNQVISDDMKLSLKLQLHTGLRIGEILSMEWGKIDFRARKIIHIESKTGQIYTIMPDSVRRLLLEWKRDTADRNSERVFIDGLNTLKIVENLKQVKPWMHIRTHKFRKTVRTYLQELGCSKEIRDLITNHTSPDGAGGKHYDHAKNDKAQLHWLELLSEKLAEIKKSPAAFLVGIDVDENDELLAEFKDIL